MKTLIMIGLLGTLLISCGKDGASGSNGDSCYIHNNFIICGDKQIEIKDGTNGIDGIDGTNGIDGIDGTNGIDEQYSPTSIEYSDNGYLYLDWRNVNGQLHRTDGPATVIYYSIEGKYYKINEIYYKNGKEHRTNGPSNIAYYVDNNHFQIGSIYKLSYKIEGQLHRTDGPAQIYFQSTSYGSKFETREYFIYNIEYTRHDYCEFEIVTDC